MSVSHQAETIITGPTRVPIKMKLSTTSADVINNYNRLLAQIKNSDTAQALKAVEIKQKSDETELVANTTMCDVPMLSALRDRIGGLQATKLKDITIDQLYNPSAMKATMCTVDSLFYTSPYDIGSLYLNNRIRNYIHNLHQIGSESAEGYALLGDFEDAKEMFVVKVSRSPTDDLLLHELVVGLYGTNKLREYIPNFAYIYGGFKCSPPLIDPDSRKVVTWCLHDQNAVNYVLYENIAPAVTMDKYIETCTGKEFVNAYLQILYATRLGLLLIDYSHYDLNYKNVLIRTPDQNRPEQNFQIAYETERGVEYITTKVISTIIDYGFSHIKIDNFARKTTTNISEKETQQTSCLTKQEKHYGRSGFVPFSIFAYRSWVMHDMYKILMFCLMAAFKFNNRSVFNEAYKIFRFFNHTDDPIVAINDQQPILFSFPLTNETSQLSINDLATYIRTVCDTDFISPNRSSDPILDCERMCLTENDILNKIGINPNEPISTPNNIIEFYDICIRLQNQGRETEKNNIIETFPYQQSMKAHIDHMRDFVRELIDIRRRLKLVDVSAMNIDQILNYTTMMIVRSMYISVGSIIDTTMRLKFYYEIGIAVAQSYQDDNAIYAMNDIMDQFNRDIKPGLEDAKKVLGRNNDYLNQIQGNLITIESIRRDKRLRWYWSGRLLFDIVFGRTDVTINKISTSNEINRVPEKNTISTTTTSNIVSPSVTLQNSSIKTTSI